MAMAMAMRMYGLGLVKMNRYSFCSHTSSNPINQVNLLTKWSTRNSKPIISGMQIERLFLYSQYSVMVEIGETNAPPV